MSRRLQDGGMDMRRSRDLLGLPVMDVSAGKIVGRVRQIIFSAAEKRIAGFVIGGGLMRDRTVIGFESVLSLGDDAVTIRESGAVRKLANLPELQSLLRSPAEIYNTGILTVSGRHLGTVDELLIADDGRISHLVVSEGVWRDLVRGVRTLSMRYVRAIGEDAIIVDDAAELVAVDEAGKGERRSRNLTSVSVSDAAKRDNTRKMDTLLTRLKESRNWLSQHQRARQTDAPRSAGASASKECGGTAQSQPSVSVPETETSRAQETSKVEPVSDFEGSSAKIDAANDRTVTDPATAELERLWAETVRRARSVSELAGRKVIFLRLGEETGNDAGRPEGSERDGNRLSGLWEYWQERLEAAKKGIDARNAEYLIGKRVARDVVSDGGVIISAGEMVTAETVEAAQRFGKLHLLVLACAVKDVEEKIAAIRSRLIPTSTEEE